MTAAPPIKSVGTAFRLIEFVKERSGARPSEIGEALGLPSSTVNDYLVTLREKQYLVRNGNEYRVSLRFLELGDQARNHRNIYEIGKSKVDELADRTGELVHLSVEENGMGVIIYETEGESAISLDTFVGRRVPMHCTALGKAMLSCMPEPRVKKIIETHGLPPMSEATITDQEEFFDQLATVRERGYATSLGERIPELSCVAAPVKNDRLGTVLGAISVCLPMTRIEDFTSDTDLTPAVQQTANRVELDLLYD